MNNNSGFKTKTFLLLCMLIPLLGISQTKTLLTSNRLFAKADKAGEFEKALAAMQKNTIQAMLRGGYGASNRGLMLVDI